MRVALAFPNIFFSLTSNGQQVFHLEAGSLKQRIVQLLGNNYNAKLVTVKEETDYLNIYGFAGKPETAKKTRGDQYFFVNNRFIRSPYLNHALQQAYQEMIPPDAFPMYVLFIDLDPTQVDVNVHPTKQEIKFEDEKIVYAFVQAAVKHALAQFSITPTLDFNLDSSIQQLDSVQKPFTEKEQVTTKSSTIFQTFTEANQAHKIEGSVRLKHWSELDATEANSSSSKEADFVSLGRKFLDWNTPATHYGQQPAWTDTPSPYALLEETRLSQLLQTYILFPVAQGFLLIHQQSAHERVIYERLVLALQGKPVATQRSLFPSTTELTPADAVILTELLPELQQMGYSIEPFGHNTFVIQGTPADVVAGNERLVLEKIIDQYKHFNTDLKLSKREMLLRTVATQQAIKAGTPLSEREMRNLVQDLFTCQQTNVTPSGRPTFLEFKKDQLEKMFGR
jgi:DNA mismatch repair protein MutL